MVQRLRGILEKQSLGMTRTEEGKRFPEEENSNMYKTVSRFRSGKIIINARPMPRTSVDVRCMCMFHTVLRSVARLSLSAVLPHDVEAVFCKLYSHYTYATVHTKISTNTPTKVIKRTGMLECQSVHNLKSSEYKRSGTSVVTRH